MAEQGAATVQVSVVAGNDDAMRFYRRQGGVEFLTALVAPVRAIQPGLMASLGPLIRTISV